MCDRITKRLEHLRETQKMSQGPIPEIGHPETPAADGSEPRP
jgi:hypothetical protein